MNRTVPHAALYAWGVVLLLWPVALLNYLDRQMISTVRQSLRDDIPSVASDEHFGYLMAAFMWVYAFLSPVGGFIADRVNRRWTVILSLLVWSALTLATGLAGSFEQLLVLRGLMGVSEAFYIPAALALIADFHPGNTRARAVGIHQTGIYAGQALAGVGVLLAASWRDAFLGFGAVGVIYSFVLLLTLRDAPPSPERPAGKEAPVTIPATLLALGRQPAFWLLVAYFTFPAIGGWLVRNWMPTYLADTFKLPERYAGIWGTASVTLASVGGAVLGGYFADLGMRFTPRGRVLVSAVGTLVCVPALVGLAYAGWLPVAVVWMVVFGIGWGAFDTNNMPILCQIARPEYRATGYGVMNLVSISVGGVVTALVGKMRDQKIEFSLAFLACAGITLGSVALVLLIRPNPQKEDRPV